MLKILKCCFLIFRNQNLRSLFISSLIALKKEQNIIIRFLKRPVQLYKVAATVIVLTGLFSFIHFTNLHEQNNNSLSNDTIYIYKTDTVYSRIIDTVKHIKEKVVYITRKMDPESTPIYSQLLKMSLITDWNFIRAT